MKLKEKIWEGKFIDISTLLKTEREAINDLASGEIKIKNERMVIETTKPRNFIDIEDWTSAFITFMSVMLEKHPSKAQELLKYMTDIRLAAKRTDKLGWGSYDEQYRLRKQRDPHSSWAIISHEYWLLYVTNGRKAYHTTAETSSYISDQDSNDISYVTPQRKSSASLYCRFYNDGRNCNFFPHCKYLHQCETCGREHRRVDCRFSSRQGKATY